MTLGVASAGEAARKCDLTPWEGDTAPRDEFFWLSEINKATFVVNTAQGLLDKAKAPAWARAQKRVIEAGNQHGNPRPKMYVRYEPLLIKEAGIDVTLIHAGRSSQDMHSAFQRTMIRDRILDAAAALNEIRYALFELAKANKDTIAPCYTNGVAAQPNNLAHTWLGHLEGFRRDFDELKEFWPRLNLSPLGTTVLNGTPWPLDREAMAKRLGFEGIIENAYDAAQISSIDIAVESHLKLVSPLLHINQFIEDIMTQYAQPRPWILVTSTYASTAMPQKRNPGPVIDVRRDASQVLGELSGVIFRAHNLMPGMYDAKDEIMNGSKIEEAAAVFRAFAKLIGMLKVNPDRALEELNLDWTASQNIADVMMKDFGIPFREGHHYASTLVTFARERELTPNTLPYADAKAVYESMVKDEGLDIPAEFPFDEAAFRALLDPRSIVESRATRGGPQKEELARLMNEAEQSIRSGIAWKLGKTAFLAKAEADLNAEFEALAAEN